MSKNYMTTVAAVLGVEMGDIFKVVNTDSNIEDEKYFQLTKKGLETSDDGIHWRGTVPSVLQDLMRRVKPESPRYHGSLELMKHIIFRLFHAYVQPARNIAGKILKLRENIMIWGLFVRPEKKL